jgi:hypothetical protein
MKTGKEVRLNNFDNYNVVIGSVNNKHAKTIYINISAWAEPIHPNDVNYNRIIRDMSKNIKQSIYNSFCSDKPSSFIKERTIVDLDIRESGIKYGKRSFMDCEITFFLNREIPVNSDDIKPISNELLNLVINHVFENNNYFKFHLMKK